MNALIADTVHLMYSFFQTHHIVLILHLLRLCFIIYLLARNTKIAALISYQDAKKDEETGLWWIPTNGTTDLLVPSDQLSSPLPVGIEGELLWF